MRSSISSLVMLSPFVLTMAVFGQEQEPIQVAPEKKNPQLTISLKSPSSNPHKGPQKVQQRMTASQKLIHQRALAQAEQRLRRINERRAKGISLSRPTINKSLFPSNVEIMQPLPTFYYNPTYFYSTWYRP